MARHQMTITIQTEDIPDNGLSLENVVGVQYLESMLKRVDRTLTAQAYEDYRRSEKTTNTANIIETAPAPLIAQITVAIQRI